MKLFYLLLIATLVSCGSEEHAEELPDAETNILLRSCTGAYVGNWESEEGELLSITSECSYNYDGNTCTSNGEFLDPVTSAVEIDGYTYQEGNVVVNILDTSGGDCLPVGLHACDVIYDDDIFWVDCGYEGTLYLRSELLHE